MQESVTASAMIILETVLSAASLVFLAELGDKTMLATVCLSAQCRRPRFVLGAAMLALMTSTALAVVVGYVLSTALPLDIIIWASGLIFIVLGIYTLLQKESDEDGTGAEPASFLSIYSLVLFSEMGDKTQVSALAIAATTGLPILVFIGATIGLFLVNAIGVVMGDRIAAVSSVSIVRRVTGLVFILFGVLILFGIL